MQHLFALLLLLSYQDSPAIEKINDQEWIRLLNSITKMERYKTDELLVTIYTVNNTPGSAGFANGEVSSNLLIAVSEYDEYPKQNLFVVKNLIKPEILYEISAKDQIKLKVKHNSSNYGDRNTLVISLDNVEFKE